MAADAPIGTTPPATGWGTWLAGQLTNVAPLITLVFLVAVFSALSPSFATVDNLANVLRQVSITAIIATGLTFVILTAEIDLSVAAIANVCGITVAFFTLQESYVNIANLPLPGFVAIILALLTATALGLRHRLRRHGDRHPVLHHDPGHAADRRRHLRHAGARPDRLRRAGADQVAGLGDASARSPRSWSWLPCSCSSAIWC